jgi:hypothetical protein
MSSLTSATQQRITALFRAADRELVSTLLIQDCGNDLPGHENADPAALERLRFAVLKLSAGDLDALQRAITLAKTDCRDVLVFAGFGEDVKAHESWWPEDPKDLSTT